MKKVFKYAAVALFGAILALGSSFSSGYQHQDMVAPHTLDRPFVKKIPQESDGVSDRENWLLAKNS